METGLSTQTAGGAVAHASNYDPYAAYGEQAAGNKTFLKFSKGEYLYGQDDKEMALGTRLVANMAGLKAGWQKWQAKKPIQEIMELIASGTVLPKRHELGDHDQALWEVDDENRPQDPWAFTNNLGMKNAEDGEEYTFTTSSRGGIGGIGQLCKEYGRVYRMKPGFLAVIDLQRDSYMHPVYKKVWVPVLKLVDWVKEDDLLSGAAEAAEEPVAPATGKKAATKF